jgi:hypothetical protein
MLKCVVLSSIWLVALSSAAAAKNTVLHCRGYHIVDQRPVTDQTIVLDMENNVAVITARWWQSKRRYQRTDKSQ